MKNRRKICVVTGSRAEYGLLRPVMEKILMTPTLDLKIVVTGMHLDSEFGNTANEIPIDGFHISHRVRMAASNDSPVSMAQSIGKGTIGLSKAFNHLKPDFLLLLGDRVEVLAATIAASYMGIPIAHIHGGDKSEAGLDESARHAITKFAHIHFPATKRSEQRLIRMGEEKWRIYCTGSPALDDIYSHRFATKQEIHDTYHVDGKRPIIVVLQHPVTSQSADAQKQIKVTLDAVKSFSCQTVIIYPNSDAGGRSMIKVIKKYVQENVSCISIESLPRYDYLGLLDMASVLIGNSSGGIIDSASFFLPVVDIGIRQHKREHAGNIIHVPHQYDKIASALKKSLYNVRYRQSLKQYKNPYGYGHASTKIAKILSEVSITFNLIQKRISY